MKSKEYRQYLRDGIRMFMYPEHEALIAGELISYMRMRDLEALFELVLGFKPRRPANYHPHHS